MLGLAVPLIMADLVRHMLQDVGLWGECGDSVAYPRVNATDPFPPSCTWSSSQYRCSVHCCVPTWEGAGWTSAQSGFFPAPGASTPQFATLSSNGSLFFPPGFDAAAQPFPVFRPPFALDAAGGFDAPRGGGRVNGVWFTAVSVSRCPRAAARGRGRDVVRCCGPQRKDRLSPLEAEHAFMYPNQHSRNHGCTRCFEYAAQHHIPALMLV